MERLTQRGIQCKPYLPCIHLQPAYRELGFTEGMFPVAESISRRSLAIPFYPQLALLLRIASRNPDLGLGVSAGSRVQAWMKRIEALPYFEKTRPPHWK